MTKKNKGLILESTPSVGYEDDKARMRHQTLMQEFQELLKETDDTRSKLEVAKQRKMKLAAEVRFLRKRYQYLVKVKPMNLSSEQQVMQPPSSRKPTKNTAGKLLGHKEASYHRSPPAPEPKSKKRRYAGKEVPQPMAPPVLNQHHMKIFNGRKENTSHRLTPVSVLKQKGRISISKDNLAWSTPPFDMNQKERMHFANDASLGRSIAAFDLNLDSSPSVREAALPARVPIFDLNEISTGDEDFQSNVEAVTFEEAKKGLIRGLSDEQQNDMSPICRNAGEGSSHVGKRKISWQDQVALRV